MNQAFQASGVQVMAPVGIEAAISQQLIPQGQQMGMTLQNQYPLPQIAAKDSEYASKLYGSDARQNICQAAGTDWTDRQGNKVLVVLHYYEMRSIKTESAFLDLLKLEMEKVIDLDAFDPSIMPSTGTPEPGGMLWYETLQFIRKVNKKRNIVGFDIVELRPNPEEKSSDFLAAKLYYKILTYVFKKRNKENG